MKTPPANTLERTETGGYPGSIGQDLTREQRLEIRKVLVEAKGPLYLTQIATRAGVDLTNPVRQQNASQFLEFLCQTSREAELHFEPGRRGDQVFKGFSATQHGRDMYEKGLV